MNWLQEHGDGVVLSVKVVPRASRTEICGEHGDFLKIKLQAPPVDGKANKQLLKFLSKHLGVPSSSLTIMSGESSRHKRVAVADMSAADVSRSLT